MATYIQGLTDYIPQLQPFKPDYNFYANALQTKQAQYDAGYNQVSSLYGSLLNSPMLRDSNIQRRDEFFKEADAQIKKISGMDLSDERNVAAAADVFKPFYEDKHIIKDMSITKQFYNELGRAEGLRNCTDPKKCGGQYWETGVKAMHYQADEFRKASDDDSLSFSPIRYTSYINVYEKATQAAKDLGLNIKVDSRSGGYIVTKKNGQLAEPVLMNHFAQLFQGDPQIQEMYKTQAYTARKDYGYSNAHLFGGDADAAEQDFITRTTSQFAPQNQKALSAAKSLQESLQGRKQILENRYKNREISLDEITEIGAGIDQDLAAVQNAIDHHTSVDQAVTGMKQSSNTRALRSQFDQMFASALFQNDIAAAAHTLAYKDYEETFKADPFALASFNSELSLKNSLTLKQVDFDIWMKKEQFKMNVEAVKKRGSAEMNTPSTSAYAPGMDKVQVALAEKGGIDTQSQNNEKLNEVNARTETAHNRWLTELMLNLQDKAKNGETADEKIAARDALYQIFGDKKAIAASPEEMLAELGKNGKVNEAYKRSKEVADPNNPVWGAINESWSRPFWEKNKELRKSLTTTDQLADAFPKFYKEQSQAVIARVKEAYQGDEREYVDYFLDAQGMPLSKEMFIERAKDKVKPLTDIPGTMALDNGMIVPLPGFIPTKIDQRERLLDRLSSAYDNIKENWDTEYKRTASPYNTLKPGDKQSAVGAPKIWNTVDPFYATSDPVLETMSYLKDFNSNADGAVVAFGSTTPGTVPQGNEAAAALVNQLYNDMQRNWKESDKGRPRFTARYEDIAGDGTQVALTITPNQDWINLYKGTDKNKGVTYGEDWKNGVTIYLPKERANNSFTESAKYTDADFLMKRTGKVEINGYRSGKAKIIKEDNSTGQPYYRVEGWIKGYNEDGQIVTQKISERVENKLLNPQQIFDIYTAKFEERDHNFQVDREHFLNQN